MAIVGAASPNAAFPLERFMAATIRLVGLLVGLWGLLQIATGLIVLIAFTLYTANRDGFATTVEFTGPLMASGPGSGFVMLLGGVVIVATCKRLTRFVTKDL